MSNRVFTRLSVKRWRQFSDVDIDLASRLCVLTGPNGSGKTTILNVLGRHFGWSHALLSTPFLTKKEKREYSDAWEHIEAAQAATESPNEAVVGRIDYSDGATSELALPRGDQPQYSVNIRNQQVVVGLHIPSHRPPPAYHRVTTIPIDPKSSQQQYQEYQNFLFATYGESSARNPATAMKQALIALAVFGEGNESVHANAEYARMFSGFQDVLRKILPDHIGFERIEVRSPDVVLKTKSGAFALESMSGGLNALFGIAWQIHTFGFDKSACTVLVDEPENHLHPRMQREFLPRLLAAFPAYRFIVASHSPFIVSSAPDAAVYALTYDSGQHVISERLNEADLAASPNAILRDVLDVPVTMPLWVESRLSETLNRYRGAPFDADLVTRLRADLDRQGLGAAFGDFLAQRPAAESEGR